MSSSRTRVPAASGPTTFEHPTPGWTYPGTAPGPAEARHDAASPPAAPVTQPAALELGTDGVPYIRKPDGSRNGLVETTTGPGGGVEFTSAPVAQAIAALGQPNQYVASDAELGALPPRLWPVDSLPYRLFRAHRGHAFGVSSGSRQIVRVDGASHVAQNVYQFPEGWAVFDIFEGDGCILACAYDADGKYALWRSADLGETFTRVHNLGQDPTGTHHAGTWLLNNGLRVGKINGQTATVLASYNSGAAIDADPPTAGSFSYVAYSLDQCQTWRFLNIWNYDFENNTGVGQRAFRHFHTVAYDPWRDCWWFGTGDVDVHSAVWRWDGRTMTPIGSATPASVAAGDHPGWDCRYGSQRWRTVDILVTEDWIETFTDTVMVNGGGIWRVRPDWTDSHRVNHDTNGIQHDGWSNLTTSSGLQLWCSNLRADAVTANQRWVGLWGSMNGNRYAHIGRVAIRAGASPYGTRGLFELNGKIWWCVLGEAGKGDRLSTNVYEPRGKFREERPDFLGPVYFTDLTTGSDSNDGHSASAPWKTYRKCYIGNVVTHGARVMISEGTSEEEGVASIEYAANSQPATDTTVGIQISGQGRDKTTILMAASGINGWKGTSSQYWDVENEGMTFRPASSARLLHNDNTTQTAGTPRWTFRDCTSGNVTVQSTYTAWVKTSVVRHIRSEILQPGSQQTIRAEQTGEITVEASIVKGRVIQGLNSRVRMLNCEHSNYASVGFSLGADAAVLPELKNVLYHNGSGALFSNLSALDVSGVIAGCVYDRTPTGMPTSPLPVAGILDRGDDLVPFAWSALRGAGVSTGVKWGFDGRPMRKVPSIGAIEAD